MSGFLAIISGWGECVTKSTKCSLPEIRFQNFTEIWIIDFCSISMSHFKSFLFANPQLNVIRLVRCSWNLFEILKFIKENLPNVEEIYIIDCEFKYVNCSTKVEIYMWDKDSAIKPSYCIINYVHDSAASAALPVLQEMLDKNVAVDSLSLQGARICDESLEIISKLKTISHLDLSTCREYNENSIISLY